jgi:hypothetical protein
MFLRAELSPNRAADTKLPAGTGIRLEDDRVETGGG